MRDHNNERGPRPMPAWRDYSGVRGPASTIESRRKSELAEIARGIFRNEIYTDRHCHTMQEIRSCFPILSMMDREALTGLGATIDGGGMLYEYMSKAMPLAVNGLPMFMSIRTLNAHEAGIAHDMIVRLFQAEEAALA